MYSSVLSRIALESAVYSSECIVVGDEILMVNLVDVTRDFNAKKNTNFIIINNAFL